MNIFKKHLELMDKKSKEFLTYKVNHILFRRKYEMKKKCLTLGEELFLITELDIEVI